MKKLALVLLAAMAFSAPSIAQERTPAAAAKQEVHIYNPDADARADIDAAVKRAKQQKKHVFIQIGGNWCIWCLYFHNLVESTPELKAFLNNNYETVLVNYSKGHENAAVLASLGYPGRFGYPVFVILDGNGKVLHTQNSAYLEEGKGHSAKKVTEFLQGWTYAAVDPATYVKK